VRGRQITGSIRVLGYGAGFNGDGEVVDGGVGGARIPLRAEVLARPRGLFWRYLVGRGEGEAVGDGYELVFGPRVGVVVEALPEGRQSSLNLQRVSGGGAPVKDGKRTCSWRTMGLLKSSGPV
jgi:hypothetical protein